MLYVDSSAFVRRYLYDEPNHELCVRLMDDSAAWATSRITIIEVHRALSRSTSAANAALARAAFDADLAETAIVDADLGTCAIATDIAVRTGVRTLDALQLASVLRVAGPELVFLTFDRRQAHAAQSLGLALAATA